MSHHSPGAHIRHHRYFRYKELDALYVSVFMKAIADSLISVFTSIFLLEHGHTMSEVALFYIVYFTCVALSVPLGRLFVANIGLKKTLALGLLLLGIFYYVLPSVDLVPYLLIAVMYGMGAGLYFASFNVDLARALRGNQSEGTSLALLRIISIFAGILGPILGALLITKGSFGTLFTVVTGLLLLSLLPLFLNGDETIKTTRFRFRKLLRSEGRRRAAVYVFHGANESGLDIIWPAFIWLNYRNVLSIGGIVSLTSLALMVLIYLAGKVADRNEVESYRIGVFSHAPTWVLKLVLLSPGGLLLTNFLGMATAYLVDIPFNKAVYDSARSHTNPADYFMFKELFTWTGRVGLLVATIVIGNFTVLFIGITLIAMAHVMLVPELKRRNLAGAH